MITSLGEAEITCFIEVKKADGRIFYYKVVNEQNIEITKEEYDKQQSNKK